MQRLSEVQLIASDTDEVIDRVITVFDEDGIRTEQEQAIVVQLRSINTRQYRQADIADCVRSIDRIGLTGRNRRRLGDLFPELDPAA